MVNVTMNGVPLTDISPAIIIREVTEQKPNQTINAIGTYSGVGQRVTSRSRNYLDVVIKFAINIMRGHEADRYAVIKAVNAWAAGGGRLAVSYRAGEHLDCMLIEEVQIGNIKKWNGDLQLTLRAYDVPYWVSNGTNSAVNGRLNLVSPVSAPLWASIKTTATGAETITIRCGSQKMAFNINKASANYALELRHDKGVLAAKLNGSSVLDKMTPDSNDCIMLTSGTNSITVTSSASGATVTADLYTYERWI